MKKLLATLIAVEIFSTLSFLTADYHNGVFSLIVTLLRPFGLGIVLCPVWRKERIKQRISRGTFTVFLSVSISFLSYGAVTEWRYLFDDAETQAFMILVMLWTVIIAITTSEFFRLINLKQNRVAGSVEAPSPHTTGHTGP